MTAATEITTGLRIHRDIAQGTDEWHAIRCGLLTASELKLIVTPSTLKAANNDKVRAHLYELLAQRITGFVEDRYVSHDMERGWEDESLARYIYSEKVAPVEEVGFITNDKWGFTLGYSPDGLVGSDGLIECKSRRLKFQVESIINQEMPDDYLIQVQAGMKIAERQWCDFISYGGGLPMQIVRVYPDEKVQNAIIEAAGAFEQKLSEKRAEYEAAIETMKQAGRYFETERRVEQEMFA